MVVKEKRVQKQVSEEHKYCDVCGVEIKIGLACATACCECCRADLCRDCIAHEETSCGDYRTVWCAVCWEIGEKYMQRVKKLEDEIENLYEEWKRECE
jgi:hypothetical protein